MFEFLKILIRTGNFFSLVLNTAEYTTPNGGECPHHLNYCVPVDLGMYGTTRALATQNLLLKPVNVGCAICLNKHGAAGFTNLHEPVSSDQ